MSYEGDEPEQSEWGEAAKEIQRLARTIRGRVAGLESRRDLEKIIGLARAIEKGSPPSV